MSHNMSYCRFQNTLEALRECREALNDLDRAHKPGTDFFDAASSDEVLAAMDLIELCQEIDGNYGHLLNGR